MSLISDGPSSGRGDAGIRGGLVLAAGRSQLRALQGRRWGDLRRHGSAWPRSRSTSLSTTRIRCGSGEGRRTVVEPLFDTPYGTRKFTIADPDGNELGFVGTAITRDTAKGNRPSFTRAAPPDLAEPLYERFCDALRELGITVATGEFGARMEVDLTNDGPVTIVLEAEA